LTGQPLSRTTAKPDQSIESLPRKHEDGFILKYLIGKIWLYAKKVFFHFGSKNFMNFLTNLVITKLRDEVIPC
jgi:hypothetical protein